MNPATAKLDPEDPCRLAKRQMYDFCKVLLPCSGVMDRLGITYSIEKNLIPRFVPIRTAELVAHNRELRMTSKLEFPYKNLARSECKVREKVCSTTKEDAIFENPSIHAGADLREAPSLVLYAYVQWVDQVLTMEGAKDRLISTRVATACRILYNIPLYPSLVSTRCKTLSWTTIDSEPLTYLKRILPHCDARILRVLFVTVVLCYNVDYGLLIHPLLTSDNIPEHGLLEMSSLADDQIRELLTYALYDGAVKTKNDTFEVVDLLPGESRQLEKFLHLPNLLPLPSLEPFVEIKEEDDHLEGTLHKEFNRGPYKWVKEGGAYSDYSIIQQFREEGTASWEDAKVVPSYQSSDVSKPSGKIARVTRENNKKRSKRSSRKK